MFVKKRRWADHDGYFTHQTAELMCEMGVGGKEPQWLEHHWFTIVPPGNDGPMLNIAITRHPNQNLLHLQNMLVVDNVQYNLRGCRELDGDREVDRISLFPVEEKVIEPWRKIIWIRHETKDSPISFHLEVESIKEPDHILKEDMPNEDMAFNHQWRRLVQACWVKYGWVDVKGKSWVIRDHFGFYAVEWGIREMVDWWGTHWGGYMRFGDQLVGMLYQEHIDNWDYPGIMMGYIVEDDGEQVQLVELLEKDWKFDEDTRDIIEARHILLDSKGKKREVIIKTRYHGAYFVGGWLGEGREPDYIGTYKIEMDEYDLSDLEMLRRLKYAVVGAKDQYVDCFLDGRAGHGVWEYFLRPIHPEYGYR